MLRTVVVLTLALLAALAMSFPTHHHSSLAVGVTSDKFERRSRLEVTRDLVLMHLPYNFGNTVAKVAALGNNVSLEEYAIANAAVKIPDRTQAWMGIHALAQLDPEFWGPLNPDIQHGSNATGGECPMFYTPQKYWPTDLASQYFGSKTVFGLIRNPYDRLVAIYRGNEDIYKEFFPSTSNNHTCDVNGAVRRMIEDYKAGNVFAQGCRFLPQVEFFDGTYGVSLPVDIHNFPVSADAVLASHGYGNVHITSEDEITVAKLMPGACDHMWGGDLDAETRRMVKDVYMKDFELLCQTFKYCDFDQADCLRHSIGMCPDKAFHWDPLAELYTPCEDYDCASQG